MPTDDRGNEHDELIERLKAQAAAADGGNVAYESDGLTPGVRRHFWRSEANGLPDSRVVL